MSNQEPIFIIATLHNAGEIGYAGPVVYLAKDQDGLEAHLEEIGDGHNHEENQYEKLEEPWHQIMARADSDKGPYIMNFLRGETTAVAIYEVNPTAD